MSQDQQPTLTTRQGRPVDDNQNTKTVGRRGPATLENYHFLEKMAHFDRERVPERVVHARGTVAHGYFEAYGTVGDQPIGTLTRAKLFQEKGKRTPVLVRFSTVIHSKDSPETLRDPRGFAVKFYTEDGNWDLVGNNLKVFFIRDAIKFPDFIHSFKPDPITNQLDPNRQFDFVSLTPEATHTITWLFSPWGIPADYRHMEGSGVNTYKWVNATGESVLVKYHWVPKQGVTGLTQEQADALLTHKTFGHATKDLHDAIERGDYPEWAFCVQIMSDEEHPELTFDPLDDTVLWPYDQFPLRPIGRMVLDKNVDNFFAEAEQAAFGTGVTVDGLEFSDDKMLQGRTFSYSDTQRYRVGANYLQLPINRPQTHVATNQRDGAMTYVVDGEGANPHVTYEPSVLGGLREAARERTPYRPAVAGAVERARIERADDYTQAGLRYRAFEDWERDDLVSNLVANLKECRADIQERMVWHFSRADADYGQRVAAGLGIAVPQQEPALLAEMRAQQLGDADPGAEAPARPAPTRMASPARGRDTAAAAVILAPNYAAVMAHHTHTSATGAGKIADAARA